MIASQLPVTRDVVRSMALSAGYRVSFVKEDVWIPATSRKVLAFQKGWIEVWRRHGTVFSRVSSLYLGEESWWDETVNHIRISTMNGTTVCLAIPVPSANIPRTSLVVLNTGRGEPRLVWTFLGTVQSISSDTIGFIVKGETVRLTQTRPARTSARRFVARISQGGRMTVVEDRPGRVKSRS